MGVLDQAVAEFTGTQVEARLLRGDNIPSSLSLGFDLLDPDWAWVAVVDSTVRAALLAAPCHGVVMVVRLVVEPGYGWALPRLLRAFIRDAVRRGYAGYVCSLDKERKEEAKILKALKRAGKVVEWPMPQWMVGGTFGDLGKW